MRGFAIDFLVLFYLLFLFYCVATNQFWDFCKIALAMVGLTAIFQMIKWLCRFLSEKWG